MSNDGGQSAQDVLFHAPVPVQEWEDGLADFYELNSTADWLALQARYEHGRSRQTHNLQPWRRCLQIARSVGAVSVVAERRYICYDYQSEFAAFYTHIHAGIPPTTHRLHFFADVVNQDNYMRLAGEKKGYLGYIVCRPRDLELVGRTVLRPPSDIPVQTAVKDVVTFFGQQLHVYGVPFMQQDERIGVCANIAAWIAHYTAYRREFFSRRYVAEFLNRGADYFRPKAAIGLQPLELLALLDLVGFRTEFLPREPDDSIPVTRYPWDKSLQQPPASDRDTESASLASEDARIPCDPPSKTMGDDVEEHDERGSGVPHRGEIPQRPIESLYDDMDLPASLRRLKRTQRSLTGLPQIRERLVEECCRNLNSGTPVVVCSLNHVTVLCGYELTGDDRVAHFTGHDDQLGPYIQVVDCLFDRYDLRIAQSPTLDRVPPTASDLLGRLRVPDSIQKDQDLDWFEWLELLIPLPSKVFLPLHRAERAALRLLWRHFRAADRRTAEGQQPFPELQLLLKARENDSLRLRSYLVQANDFKHRIRERGADALLSERYRSLRLSEFVAVVEFVDADDSPYECLGEVVFDATSNPKNPWVHALRLETTVVLVESDGKDQPPFGVTTRKLYAGARCFQAVDGSLLAKQVADSDGNQE